MNTMMNGEEKDKIELSYRLIDDKNHGFFVKEDLSVMIKQIVNSWVAITQTTMTKEMLSNVDRQINHIFKVMDIKKHNKVDKQDFLLALQKFPDLLEIFDFLNQGVTDTVLNNENRQRELQIAKEICCIEKYLENINAFLIGETNYLQDIYQSNNENINQKMDIDNKDPSNKGPFQEITRKLNSFGKFNERQLNERDRERFDEQFPENEKGFDVSNQTNTIYNVQSIKKIGNQISTKTIGQDQNMNTAKNIQQSKFDLYKKNITHSLSVDLKNKAQENQSNDNEKYLNTEQDLQNQQNSNYRSNMSEYGSNEPRRLQDERLEDIIKKEEDERVNKQQNEQVDEISNHSNYHQLSPFSKKHKKSIESNQSSNVNYQQKNQQTNQAFGMIYSHGYNRFNQRSNSVYNNQAINQNENQLQIHRISIEKNHNIQQRGYSMQSNSNDIETAQFMTSQNKQSYIIQNQHQQQLKEIQVGENQNFNENDNHHATFQHQNLQNMNLSSSINADNNKIGVTFQIPQKKQIQPSQNERFQTPQHQNQELIQQKSKLNQQSQIQKNFNHNDEEAILKKYESVMCMDCVFNVTQKFKQDMYKDQWKLSSIIQQKKQQSDFQNIQALTPRQQQQRHVFSTQNKHLNDSNQLYDKPNSTQMFLGDLDETESCCIGSDDDEYKKKSNNQIHQSPHPNLTASTYQLNPQNAQHQLKYCDTGHSATLKKQKNHQIEKPSLKIQNLNNYDQQLKNEQKEIDKYNNLNKQSENKFYTEESTSRQMRIHNQADQNENYTLSSNEQMITPRTYNILAFYEKVEKTNIGEKNDRGNTQQISVPSNFVSNIQNTQKTQQNAASQAQASNSEGNAKNYPYTSNKILSNTNIPETNVQTFVSLGNATSTNQVSQNKSRPLSQNQQQNQQPNEENLNTDDIEIEITANAVKVGKKFIQTGLSIKEINNQTKNIEKKDNDKQKNNLINGQEQTPNKSIYVESYKNNNKNTLSKQQPSNSYTQNINSNRILINASNLKSNKDVDSNSENVTQNNALIQTPSILKKQEQDEIKNSLQQEQGTKIQFGNKDQIEKQQFRRASKDINYQIQENIKYSNKNIDITGTTAVHYNCYEVPEQYCDSSENLIDNDKNDNEKNLKYIEQSFKNQYQGNSNYSNQKIENIQDKPQQYQSKNSLIKADSATDNNTNKNKDIYQIDQIQRIQTDNTLQKVSNQYQRNQDYFNNDSQINQKRGDQSDYQNIQSVFMRQNIQSLGTKRQSGLIQQIMDMGIDELKQRAQAIFSYVKEIQQYAYTIRRNIETNMNARQSERHGSIIQNTGKRLDNKNRKTCILPHNKVNQQLNQSVQGRFQAPQLNQSGINFNRPLAQQYNHSEDDTLRISTIGNIQKKQSKEKEPRKPKLMVFFGHENWNLVVNMMMGIQMSVQSAASNLILNENNTYPELQNRDYKVKYLFELLPRKDNFEKEWSYKVCKFQDYAPNVFKRIRMFYNISDELYLKSLGPNQLFSFGKGGLKSFSQLTSTGKSGSFFYYTADGMFTLKTVSRTEFHHLKLILKNYYEHVKENRSTLIIKFFGLHKIKIRMKKSSSVEIVYIVIMSNVFHTTKLINLRYDLKGSKYGRTTKEKTQGVTLKDLDFEENKTKILAKYDEYELFMDVVRKDAKFFEENNIIDYSMLVGIHFNTQQNQDQSDYVSNTYKDQFSRAQNVNQRDRHIDISNFTSRDNKFTYLFGIIDILTCFNTKKKFEYIAKRIALGPNISAIPPSQYCQRFINFMDDMFDDDSKIPPELK